MSGPGGSRRTDFLEEDSLRAIDERMLGLDVIQSDGPTAKN